ncbi:YbaB/EbfC family nucleoid-associated protein [Prauserella endophytica]|uniref:YbaB/EbfC family nucleoid-associated protein n=1 Tax=Prauserella endophytica TaxID=1592324 RepID=A0ABY2S9C7_9PSEU|nr:YbaB/EbfC family nucleoid-associated protein [Prauserella endophytica]TKG72500.1 YbaB/EbfC family nucleoid-associated protein [Prauserella endophytica]
MSETAKRLLRRIEAIDTAAAENRTRAEAYRRMTEELDAATGTATSPDGVVTVVAGPDGSVKEITFSGQVRAVQPAELSAGLLHTIAQARAAAARAQAEMVRRVLGDTELLDEVLAENARMFGDQRPVDPDPRAPSAVAVVQDGRPRPRAAARRPRPLDDDGFEDFRVLGR